MSMTEAQAIQGKVFFVTGTMRSGTSLLSDLLYSRLTRTRRHPDIVFSMEGMPTFRHGLMMLRNSKPYRASVQDPAWLPTFGRTVDVGEVTVSNHDELAMEMVRQLRERLASVTRCPIEAMTRFGVKYTGIRNEFLLFREQFPDARLVVMVRDPRDVVASHKFRTLSQPPTRNLSIIHDILNMARFAEHHVDDPTVLVLRYEDLVADQRGQMERVLTFLDLDPNAYDWASVDKGLLSNSSFGDDAPGGRVKVVSGVAAAASRYKRYLSASEVQMVELLTAPVMRRFGYAPEDHGDLSLPATSVLATYLPLVVRSGHSINDNLSALRVVAEAGDFENLLDTVLTQIASEAEAGAQTASAD